MERESRLNGDEAMGVKGTRKPPDNTRPLSSYRFPPSSQPSRLLTFRFREEEEEELDVAGGVDGGAWRVELAVLKKPIDAEAR